MSPQSPPPLPLPRVFPARKNVRRDCCRMLPVSSAFATICNRSRLKCVGLLSTDMKSPDLLFDILAGISSNILSDILCISPDICLTCFLAFFPASLLTLSDILCISPGIFLAYLLTVFLTFFLTFFRHLF